MKYIMLAVGIILAIIATFLLSYNYGYDKGFNDCMEKNSLYYKYI